LAGAGVSYITELTECAAVPDPYPIDNDLELLDDEYPTPTQRPEPSRRKTKRDSVQPAEPLTAPPSADDPVVVDRVEVEPAPVEAERPRHRERERERPRRERGNSDAMATLAGVAGTAAAVSGFKNMFGLGRKKAAPEDDRRARRRTAVETEDDRRHRKRSTTRGGMTEDEAKRLRHERRSVRKSGRAPDAEAEPMMTGANGSPEADPEREARRAARRARHEQDKESEAKAERRRERARDTERDALADKKARQMAELERRNKLAEEELRRMAEKDEKRKSRKPTERSSRRKDKEPQETSRPHNERRRSHADDDVERRRRHEERRAARRNSEYPVQADGEPIADYFDERNGTTQRPTTTKQRSSRRTQDEEENMPYMNKGPDKTSSWVQSLTEEPPLPPPISETVLDPVPGGHVSPDDEETPSQDEDIRLRIAGRRGGKRDKGERAEKERDRAREDKDRKHSRRKSHFEGGTRGSVEESDKRKERRKTYANPAYEEPPVRTWDGRPAVDGNAGNGKRGSWFKKIF
jgi:hypothetical protein